MTKVALLGILFIHFVIGKDPKPPKIPDCYIIRGILYLPYAEIVENFTGFYDMVHNRSRIDYYDVVQTYQIGSQGDYGVGYKVAPMTTEEILNENHCFQINGTESAPINIQSSIPDVSDFEYAGNKLVNNKNCSIWLKSTNIGGKKNTYYYYVNIKNGRPIRFEMLGYDTLFGSHYDHYYIDYKSCETCKTLPDYMFQPPKDLQCSGFPGPGHEHITMNPLKEYIHGEESHVHQAFNHFVNKHDKKYNGDGDMQRRKITFRQNLRYIHSKNRAGLSYQLAVNHLADQTTEEMALLRGRKRTREFNGGMPFDSSTITQKNLPEYFDWRLLGAVTPVKDQAVCGSCWTFGTTGCVEGAYFLKNKELVRLSQQELIDCSWGEGNNGCDGGEDFRAYQWIMKHGLATEDDYGHYSGQDGLCKMKSVKPTAQMEAYVNVTSGDADALKQAIVNFGPVSVAIDAAHKSLSFYSSGIYFEPECGNKLENLDHAVLAVGYGEINGEAYWLVKNSWSTYWGNDGYVLMAQKDNNCGVLTIPTYVVI